MTEPRGLSRDVIQNLESKGHILAPYKWGYIGEANGILITEDGFYGGGDSRGETSAIGY
jgi:gamma-glutamyltranspeptidase